MGLEQTERSTTTLTTRERSSTILYVQKEAENVHPGEEHLINEAGVTIGTIDSIALPVPQDMVVSEKFAGAHLYTDTITLDGSKTRYALLLMARSEDIKIPFSSLCSELLNPGINGEFRKEILSSPTTWWMQWKELLGNRNVDERVYDLLGELLTLRYLATHGEHAEWNGPAGATYDIDCDGKFYEVKSTTARNKREITLSNHFQLDPPNGFPLFLVLCQFEAAQSGDSINSLVSDLASLSCTRSTGKNEDDEDHADVGLLLGLGRGDIGFCILIRLRCNGGCAGAFAHVGLADRAVCVDLTGSALLRRNAVLLQNRRLERRFRR